MPPPVAELVVAVTPARIIVPIITRRQMESYGRYFFKAVSDASHNY